MASLVNAAPKFSFGGINDQSRGTFVREPETYPQNLPLLRLFTETGPETTTLLNANSGSIADIFGGQTLNRRSKFYNSQSLLAEVLLAEGNPVFIKRLRPEDAPNPARITIGIDIVEDEIPAFTETLNGFNYPNDGDGGIVEPTEFVTGYRAKIVLLPGNTAELGKFTTIEGSMTSSLSGEQSTIYPLFEVSASFFGEGGNNLGMRIWAPTVDDALPFDQKAATEFNTRMYRIQFVRRASPGASAVAIRTAIGEEYVDVSFEDGVYSSSSDKEYYVGDVLLDAYQDDGYSSGAPPLYSPFGALHVYHNNLDEVRQMLYDKELEVNPAAVTHLSAPEQYNPFTGIDVNGQRYHAIFMEGPLEGGIRLGKETNIFAEGGGDGTVTLEEYERLVNLENLNFGEMGDEYENVSMYPFSTVIDTGLSMEAKFNMMRILGRRQDVRTIFTTFVEEDGRAPTRSEELSRAQALMAQLRAYPESTLHGTPVCRAEIVTQTGKLAEGNYRKPVPQVIDYMQRWARYAGAGTGALRPAAAIDKRPNNQVSLIKDLNVEFFNERLQGSFWEAGATYSLTYDRRSNYYPAVKSVYSDDTSVLISPVTVSICCDVMRLVRRVHADFSGNSELTKEQLIEQCDNRILQLVDGRYGERVQIIPETYFTDADDQRGFSWHCKVTVYANNPRTVMIFDLETRRMDELGQ